MYKPPTNTNRVKLIKNKFESFDSDVSNDKKSPEKVVNVPKNGSRNHLINGVENNNKTSLSRQLSDPLKKNIKRTPAFRVDKSLEQPTPFQRNVYANRSTTFENKVKQFNSAVKTNCDNNCNVINGDHNKKSVQKNKLIVSDVSIKQPTSSNNNMTNKPLLFKSKSSADFKYIRSKFDTDDNKVNETVIDKEPEIIYQNQSALTEISSVEKLDRIINKIDLSKLYTEPIPKALRKKNCDTEESPDIYNTDTLKIGDNPLTDTLKSALKRPLPTGPAPKKPPRTFQHILNQNNLEGNPSFLHNPKPNPDIQLNIKPSKKTDHKYMLSKLENALKNNKLRARRQPNKIDLSTTSGEDSDDSLLFKSKSHRTLPKLPLDHEYFTPKSSPTFDLNCFNGLTCGQSNYEKLKEPMSSFFVDRKAEEPVYAEPFHHRNGKSVNGNTAAFKRNSLYYMSSPVISSEEKTNHQDGPSNYEERIQEQQFKQVHV